MEGTTLAMRVIVNADDFGYSDDTVRATIKCLEDNVVTSATIMPKAGATAEALEYARTRPDISFGVHLTLVDDLGATCVCEPANVPHLAGRDGRLRATNVVRARALAGLLPVEELEREIAAQIEAVMAAGVPVTHVDSHRHIHKWGTVRTALHRTLPRLGIERARSVQDVYLSRPRLSPTVWLGDRWRRDLERVFSTTDHLYLPSTTLDRGWAPALLGTLGRLRGETVEIGVHPGYEEKWRRDELADVTTFAAAARDARHQLVDWRNIGLPVSDLVETATTKSKGKVAIGD